MSNKGAKPRPNKGPGANGLRGGANVYSNKTAIGSWMESYGGPGGYKRGFSSDEFMTEGQNQQYGTIGANYTPELFGAPLPPRINPLDYNPNRVDSKDWGTESRSSFTIDWPNEWKPGENMTKEELTAYRQKWCSDKDIGRRMRFETESQRAGNAAATAALKTNRIRALPGTPLSLEQLKAQLIENHGILAVAAFKFYLGNGMKTDEDLKDACKTLGIKLTTLQFSQIMAFLTTSLVFDTNKFYDILAVTVSEARFDDVPIKRIWNKIFGDGDDSLQVENERILEVIEIANSENPELVVGLQQYLRCYGDGYVMTVNDFVQLHSDFFASAGDLKVFQAATFVLWGEEI